MAKLSHYFEYLAVLSGTRLAQLLSARMADRLGAGLGSIAHTLATSRRRIAIDNLQQALGDQLSEADIARITKEVFCNIARTTVEFARFKNTGIEGARRITFGDGKPLQQAAAEGKGVVCVTAHFGNWELLGCWVATLGYPTDFLVGTQHNKMVDQMLIGFRKEMGVGIIPLKSSLRGVFKALRAGHIVGLVADQHDPTGGLVIDFLGRKATASRGPALFAARAGVPLAPILLRRERYDRHTVIVGDLIYPPESGDDEADVRQMTIAYTRFFENWIRQYPDQWMWTHRRWKL